MDAGDLKLLAVGASERWPTVPNVPTIAESGVPGYAVVGWYGLVFPAGTPQAIVDKMHKALAEVLARPAVREQLSKVGAEVRSTLAAGIRRAARRRSRQVEEGARQRRACSEIGRRRSRLD